MHKNASETRTSRIGAKTEQLVGGRVQVGTGEEEKQQSGQNADHHCLVAGHLDVREMSHQENQNQHVNDGV